MLLCSPYTLSFIEHGIFTFVWDIKESRSMKKTKKQCAKEIIRNIVSVSGIVLFAKLLGFVKQIVMAAFFGATVEKGLISLSQSPIGNMDYLLV